MCCNLKKYDEKATFILRDDSFNPFGNETLLLTIVKKEDNRIIMRAALVEKSLENIKKLNYIQTGFMWYEERFLPLENGHIQEEIYQLECNPNEYGMLELYRFEYLNKQLPSQLEYIGQLDLEPPINEFYPLNDNCMCYFNSKNLIDKLFESYNDYNQKGLTQLFNKYKAKEENFKFKKMVESSMIFSNKMKEIKDLKTINMDDVVNLAHQQIINPDDFKNTKEYKDYILPGSN